MTKRESRKGLLAFPVWYSGIGYSGSIVHSRFVVRHLPFLSHAAG